MKRNKKEVDESINLGPREDLFGPASNSYVQGGSIEKHRYIEEANEYFAEKEISQQMENN